MTIKELEKRIAALERKAKTAKKPKPDIEQQLAEVVRLLEEIKAKPAITITQPPVYIPYMPVYPHWHFYTNQSPVLPLTVGSGLNTGPVTITTGYCQTMGNQSVSDGNASYTLQS